MTVYGGSERSSKAAGKVRPQPVGMGQLLHRRNSGFTLIEMMITLVIGVVFLTQVVPAYNNQMQNARMSSASRDLLGSFAAAKSESVGRSDFVTVCKRNSDATGCVTAGNWKQGWIAFVDRDADGTVDVGDEIIQIHPALADGITARGMAQIADRITYRPNGMTNLTGTQTLVLCDDRGFGEHARGVVVSLLGKASIMQAPDTGQTTCLVDAS